MASVHREILIDAPAVRVWDALRDVGALHTRLVPGFVVDCILDGDARHVTFANGVQAKELIVDVDDTLMRVSWTAVGGRLTHHNASAQVSAAGAQSCRVQWVADLLPHELAPAIAGMIEQGLAAMKRAQEQAVAEVPTYYHGTKADLAVGDLIGPGYTSNYGSRRQAAFVYLSATLEAAIWGAELAVGEMRGRIYIVEPTGPIEDDPNLTNKRFPGNPTRSYRSRSPFRVLGEVTEWNGHPPERLKEMRDHLEQLRQRGVEAIEE